MKTRKREPRMVIPAAVPWRTVAVFLAATFGGVWLAGAVPLLSGRDPKDPGLLPFVLIAMVTPSLGVLVAAIATGEIRRPRTLLAGTGITPLRPWPRIAGYSVAGLVLPVAMTAAALGVGALAGTFRFHDPFPVEALISSLSSGLILLPIGVLLVFGEEWGWSYLLPKLLPLGLWPGMLLSGVIWGVFHAPFTLAGYHYPNHPDAYGVLFFTIASVLLGTITAWLRLASGSIWPAVAAHAGANFLASAMPDALGAATNPAQAALTVQLAGWPGWVVMAVVIAALALTGQFRKPAVEVPVTATPVPAGR